MSDAIWTVVGAVILLANMVAAAVYLFDGKLVGLVNLGAAIALIFALANSA